MKRRLPLICALAFCAFAGTAAPANRRIDSAFRSQALGGSLRFEAYLPPGYATSGKRYPVLYFLHGLPAGPTGYKGGGFVADALARVGRPAIVVTPQGSRRV